LSFLLVVVGACGETPAGGPADTEPATPVDETVEIVMVDFAFEPKQLTVRAGTTVRFRFRNEGQFLHDAAFGDEATQKAVSSGKATRDGPEVGPNKTKDYVRAFTQSGQLLIGCHQPGHYQQGMVARLTVV
jgi:uncharacterized cupredoxin-like copper-binding protein